MQDISKMQDVDADDVDVDVDDDDDDDEEMEEIEESIFSTQSYVLENKI